MKIDKAQIKDVYVPLVLIVVAAVLMMVTMLLQSSGVKNSSQPANIASGGFLGIILKIVLPIIVIPLLMMLCDWFEHPFVPFGSSFLKLLAVNLFSGAIVSVMGFVFGGTAPVYTGMVVVLGLLGYFFSDDAIEALIAIFLLYAAYSVVFLIPYITRLFS
jgi:hypothetical protein